MAPPPLAKMLWSLPAPIFPPGTGRLLGSRAAANKATLATFFSSYELLWPFMVYLSIQFIFLQFFNRFYYLGVSFCYFMFIICVCFI